MCQIQAQIRDKTGKAIYLRANDVPRRAACLAYLFKYVNLRESSAKKTRFGSVKEAILSLNKAHLDKKFRRWWAWHGGPESGFRREACAKASAHLVPQADVRRSLRPREEEIIAVASDLVGIPGVGLSKPVALRFRKIKFRS